MKVFDRILNKEVSVTDIDGPVLIGRYIFISENSNLLLNGGKIKKNDFIVPCDNHTGYLSNNTKIDFIENELFDNSIDSLLKHSLIEVSEELEIADLNDDLKDINILLRNFDKRLKITQFEKFFKKKLFHIEEVCRDPAYYLKREITKVNVARAKRIPYKAVNYLAAHTEDWSRRRIRSVEPRKILSEIIDYDLKIYENQVTSSFIDKLLVYFSHRMVNEIDVIDRFIEKIEQIIESRKRIDSNEKLFWYKKLNRDYDKLGDAVKSIEKSREKIEKIKDFIDSIQMHLFALLKSDLYLVNYKHINIVNQSLKRTNLFDNHQHYRFIKILWEKFHTNESLNCLQVTEANQKVVKSYIDYSWLLIFRALFQIGFNKASKKNEYSFELTNENISDIIIEITKNRQQNIEVAFNGNKTITFIPIPSTKNNLSNKNKDNTYYLTLAGSKKREDVLKISPININSEEYLARIFFLIVLDIFTNNFYYKLNSQKISEFKILNNWLQEQKSLIIDKGENGKIDFWLKRKLNDYEIKELKDIINKQKRELSARAHIRSKQLEKLKEIEQEIKINGKEHFEKYETCIVCSLKNERNLTTNYEGGFKYKCNNRGCEVEYGFTEKGIFYKVPDYDIIEENISNRYKKLDYEILLNAFGYEYIK